MLKLTDEQWATLRPLIPKVRKRKPGERGRPSADFRLILNGILWVLKTGAQWRHLPNEYPPYQTCYGYFRLWVKTKAFEKILKRLVEDLRDRGKIDLTETFIDASFAEAKKGVRKSAKPSVVRAPRSWPFATARLFLSPYPLKVLHRMRVNLLSQRFGKNIRKTFLNDLSETKLTILIHSMNAFEDDIESNLLLPTSQIGKKELKMAELFAATKEDGKLKGSFHGFNPIDE